jgi:hypothetical protein
MRRSRPKIPSLPYDVLDSNEARALAQGDPYTFLHVVKAEIDFDPSIDPHDPRVYAKAGENFQAMRHEGWLVRDERPAFYLYRQQMGDHARPASSERSQSPTTSRVGSKNTSIPGRTRKTTAPGTRTRSVLTRVRCFSPTATVPQSRRSSPLSTRRDPAVEFVAGDGIGHALWVVDDPVDVARLEAEFRDVPESYIADGHHRAAAYARVAPIAARAGVRAPRGSNRSTGFSPFIFPRRSYASSPTTASSAISTVSSLRGSCGGSRPRDSIS